MAHAIACYTDEGKLECCCEELTATELLAEHGVVVKDCTFKDNGSTGFWIGLPPTCEVCGAAVSLPGQWCPRCMQDSLE